MRTVFRHIQQSRGLARHSSAFARELMEKSENALMKDATHNQSLIEFADKYLREAFPNPTRVGCPDDEALQKLAEHPMRANMFITQHISCCSPCYARYATLLQDLRTSRSAGILSKIRAHWDIRRVVLAWGTVAVFILSVSALWFGIFRRPAPIYSAFTI